MRISNLVSMLVLLVLAAGAWAQAPATRPGYLQHLGEEYQTLLVINDPLPVTQRILRHAKLRNVLLKSNLSPRSIDTWQLSTQLKQAERWVPQEIAIGTTEAGMKSMDGLVRVFLLSSLCMSAANVEEGAKDLPKLQDLLLADLKDLRLPQMRMWVRFRNGTDAAMLLKFLGTHAVDLNTIPGVKATVDEKSVTVTAQVEQLMDGITPLELLQELEVVNDKGQRAVALAEAVGKLTATARMEQVDDGLLLTLEPAAPPVRPATQVAGAATTQPAASSLVWARWDIRSLKKASVDWTRFVREYEETPIGKELVRMDEEGLLGTLKTIAHQLELTAGVGVLNSWTDGALHAEVLEFDVPPAVRLGREGRTVMGMIPPGTGAWAMDGRRSLGDLLLEQLAAFEDRLATQSVKADLRRPDAQGLPIKRFEQAYYQHLAEFRDQVMHAVDVFEAPVATMLTTHGKIQRVLVEAGMDPEPIRLEAADLPMIELAIVGKPKANADPMAFLQQLQSSFARGIASAAGREKEKLPQTTLQEVDLKVGVKTWGFDRSWIDELSKEGKIQFSIEGDLTLHCFEAEGGYLVISTSPRLSRAILAASKDARERQRIELIDPALIAQGHLPAETLATLFDYVSQWITALDLSLMKAGGPKAKKTFEEMSQVMTTAAELTRLLNQATWQTWDRPGQPRTTRFELTVKREQ